VVVKLRLAGAYHLDPSGLIQLFYSDNVGDKTVFLMTLAVSQCGGVNLGDRVQTPCFLKGGDIPPTFMMRIAILFTVNAVKSMYLQKTPIEIKHLVWTALAKSE